MTKAKKTRAVAPVPEKLEPTARVIAVGEARHAVGTLHEAPSMVRRRGTLALAVPFRLGSQRKGGSYAQGWSFVADRHPYPNHPHLVVHGLP